MTITIIMMFYHQLLVMLGLLYLKIDTYLLILLKIMLMIMMMNILGQSLTRMLTHVLWDLVILN